MNIFASKSDNIEERELRHAALSRELAGECIVLLKNRGVLPLESTKKIALYGNGARHTIKGGTGSGDVNTRSNVNIEQGLLNAGYQVTTRDWLDRQDAKAKKDKEEYLAMIEAEAAKKGMPSFTVMFDFPYAEPAAQLITSQDMSDSETDTAVYVISRISGEGADRYLKEGDYLLYPEEQENIRLLAQNYEKTIVVLNVGGVMDLSGIADNEGVGAILLMTQLGNIGGDALADVITGKVNPSGKTTDTWAADYMDYPSSEKFSHNESVHDEMYEDGIYVGYRYFDTFGVKPKYCFGYGLSYTQFEFSEIRAEVVKNQVTVSVNVKNTGDKFAGKEVVQVYYSAPVSDSDKPYRELAAFGKTALLAPGESRTMKLSFPVRDMAGYSTKDAAWVLTKGDYIIYVGNSIETAAVAGVFTLENSIYVQTGENLFPPDVELSEIAPDPEAVKALREAELYKYAALGKEKGLIPFEEITTQQCIYQRERICFTATADHPITLQDILQGRHTVEELVAQLSVEEMATLCVGTLRADGGSVIGNASAVVPGAAGDISSILYESRQIPGLIMADGPAGLRLQPHFKTTKEGKLLPGGEIMGDAYTPFDPALEKEDVLDFYQYCTAIPIGWALAQSWNTELVQQAGDMIGAEMEQFHVDLWLAPAMNIHRNPFCGRNFEYYSEDPLVSGKIAAAITRGVQAHAGKGTVIKHFAVNNQEDNRYFVNAHVSERALREIYLKGFEIAVKESAPVSIMTSYNLLNGTHTANSKSLIQGMARDEWGFDGLVMTDWFTSQHLPALTGKFQPIYPISASTGCIYAGNDLQMPGCEKNVQDIIMAVKTGEETDGYTITLADLQYNAANIVRTIVKLQNPAK